MKTEKQIQRESEDKHRSRLVFLIPEHPDQRQEESQHSHDARIEQDQ